MINALLLNKFILYSFIWLYFCLFITDFICKEGEFYTLFNPPPFIRTILFIVGVVVIRISYRTDKYVGSVHLDDFQYILLLMCVIILLLLMIVFLFLPNMKFGGLVRLPIFLFFIGLDVFICYYFLGLDVSNYLI